MANLSCHQLYWYIQKEVPSVAIQVWLFLDFLCNYMAHLISKLPVHLHCLKAARVSTNFAPIWPLVIFWSILGNISAFFQKEWTVRMFWLD